MSSSSCSSSDRTYVNTAPAPLAHLRDFVRAFSLRRARSELDTRRSVRGRSVRHDREMAGRHADPFSAADSEQSFAQPLCFILCGSRRALLRLHKVVGVFPAPADDAFRETVPFT